MMREKRLMLGSVKMENILILRGRIKQIYSLKQLPKRNWWSHPKGRRRGRETDINGLLKGFQYQDKDEIASSSSDESDSSREESDSDIEKTSVNMDSDDERKEINVRKRKNGKHPHFEGEDQANLLPKTTPKKKLVESPKVQIL